MNGVTIIVIVLVPIVFQLIKIAMKQKQMRREMDLRLQRIEDKLMI